MTSETEWAGSALGAAPVGMNILITLGKLILILNERNISGL